MKRPDNYQYQQGRIYAVSILLSAQSTLSEPTLMGDLVKNLEDNCANKPTSFAEGIMSIVLAIKLL